MPEMPAFLANFLEPRFARAATVMAVEELAPRLRRVRFAGPALRGVSFRAGQEIELRVSDRAFRHYTPSSFDADKGELEVIFFLHGNGPGSAWASALQPGQRAGILGPGGHFTLREARHQIFLGDETAIGVFAAMAKGALGFSSLISGAIEVEAGGERWPGLAGLELPGLARRPSRGAALLEWLEQLPPTISPLSNDACFYLAGHAATIVRLRSTLLLAGWPKRSIRTKGYWAEGKRGM